MPASFTCPNCDETKTSIPNVCVLEGLASCLVARGVPVASVTAYLETLDVDAFWARAIGPLLNSMEDEIEAAVPALIADSMGTPT
jgi:hypothetical protein